MMLVQCFEAMKVYGKTPAQVQNLVAVFCMALEDYPIEKIRKAFGIYLKRNSDLPAPADIVQIIERGGRPPLEKSVYSSMLRKDAMMRTPADWQYIRDYERYAQSGEFQ